MQFVQSGDEVILEAFIKDWTNAQVKQIERNIRSGYMQGETLPEIGQKLPAFVNSRTKANNKALVRTVVNHVSNEVREASFLAEDSVIGHEWVAKLDTRTSQICTDLDGTEFIYGEDSPILKPPAHPNCRSTIAPLFAEGVI